MTILKMTDVNLTGKHVLIRSDLNVPIKNGKVTSDARIKYSFPTIETALKNNAYVMVASHLGRPKEGDYDEKFSMQPIVDYLRSNFFPSVRLEKNYLDGVKVANGELVILENVRFNKGEKKNDEVLAKKYAALCDIFVMDAFGSAHRAHASTHGVSKFANVACAGKLLLNELETLKKILLYPERPMIAVIGGSKISTKLTTLNALAKIADQLVVVGGIANTFLAAQGRNVGKSHYEIDFLPEARRLMKNNNILIPVDVYIANSFSGTEVAVLRHVSEIQDNEIILDLGDISITSLLEIQKKAKTILWSGPVGVFELPNFRRGTEIVARSIANSKAFTVAGGGDTLAAIDLFGIHKKISYISTGGGAFLKYIEMGALPAVNVLEERMKRD
ncbi:phosphoglycerate kinase [Sodalis sp. CWE]|uniref:phosphoglycerate kinase n=1 Tax=Sodalis sp. CWE TaxID=2803816 RepID=UPI001C7E01F8|nr:phosphoglycerate kinase [Sodalis sp. CWE]MBX4180895.1 phosphoglycerate kinase [Sodalis sp. CWE]